MTGPDPRQVAAMVGRIFGQEDLTELALSGRMSANEALPMLAGVITGATVQVFAPIVGAGAFTGFQPRERPLQATYTMLDGSKITITLEADR